MRTVVNGTPTNDLLVSAHVDGNGGVFPKVLDLYVLPGSRVADVTHGDGVFWREVPDGRYELLATDLATGTDCRELPYGDASVDCVVLDPPYMHSPGGTAHASGSHSAFERYYANNRPNRTGSKYHEAVIELYDEAGREAWRVLRDRGVLIVKCQDEVCSNRQRLTHVELITAYQAQGFVVEDLFVVVRTNSPGVSRAVRQVHARKNHSYFLVLWKRTDKSTWERPLSAIDLFLDLIKPHASADKWTGSRLESFRRVHNTTRGEIGEEFIRRYLAQFGIAGTRASRIASEDLTINGMRFEVKTASEDTGGNFQFNHIRHDREYDYLLCLGVYPDRLGFAVWTKGALAEHRAGKLVRMAEGQSVTFKLTKRGSDLLPIEQLPAAIRAIIPN